MPTVAGLAWLWLAGFEVEVVAALLAAGIVGAVVALGKDIAKALSHFRMRQA
ncbi:hypothetical protein [Streptomyces sp. NPDC049915]|uniref:hypothetical protein n=1 Tax=Streptomyces sp. NPDC049915 TaxID=3155510 RepID=UPI00343F208F